MKGREVRGVFLPSLPSFPFFCSSGAAEPALAGEALEGAERHLGRHLGRLPRRAAAAGFGPGGQLEPHEGNGLPPHHRTPRYPGMGAGAVRAVRVGGFGLGLG